jgi:hypothetical protein
VKIFINYRRDDSAGHAGRVRDRLTPEFGRSRIFMDVAGIRPGADFAKVLFDKVAACDVLLALIGPRWIDARDKDGNRRLDSTADYVRIEIATALRIDIPLIPILLDDATIPRAQELPKDIEGLVRRNGLHLHDASFDSDISPRSNCSPRRRPGAPRKSEDGNQAPSRTSRSASRSISRAAMTHSLPLRKH